MSHDTDTDGEEKSADSAARAFDRRTVLGSLGAVGAGLIAGCSGDGSGGDQSGGNGGDDAGDGSGGNGGDDGGEDGDQTEVGTLNYADPERPPTYDPHALDPSNTSALYGFPENGYETLIYYSAESDAVELVPALATEVPTSENGLITEGPTIEFPLREGVTFHTGEEMTAEDVRYSWNRVMTMGLAPGASALDNAIDSMEVVDDYTFRVTLSQPTTPIFLNSVVTGVGATVVSKAAVEENGGVAEGDPNEWMAQNSAGTGPFVLGDRTPNTQEWAQHEDYWGETGVDRVQNNFVGDLSSRISQLGEGDMDTIFIATSDITEVEGLDNIELTSGPQINPGGINFNYNIPYDRDDVQQIAGDDTIPSDFFTDRRVRQAFAYAVPWSTHIEEILGGYGSRTNCVHVPGTFGYDPDAPQWEQDLDTVEQLLSEAGYWDDGFTVTLANENLSEFERLNLLIKDTLEGINDNITINSVSEPEGPAIERHSADPPGWPAEVHGLLPIGTDPTPYYEFFMHPDGDMASRNGAHEHISDRIIELIEQTRTETDQDARLEQFAELQQLTYEEVPVAYSYAPEVVHPHRSCVDGKWVSAWGYTHFRHWDVSNC